MEYSFLKHKGMIYRIEKQPFETHEQLMDRTWYIAKHINLTDYKKTILDSLLWMYQKYFKVKY